MGRILRQDRALTAEPGPGSPARRLPAEVLSAAEGARRVLERAEAEAARLREAVARERELVLSQAGEAGYRAGLARAAATLARAAAERDRLLQSASDDLVRLAVAVAGAVLRREVERGGDVEALAARALEAVRHRRQVTLRVHPDDAAGVRGEAGRLGALLNRAPALAVQEDPAVGRGGLLVETEAGTLDARLETRLEAVEAALLEEES
ncbi:MAG TPA: FliH/SctL family protein [Anaeromyxobacteraceae bacterium]|nr:FliH/SctL family protein [Anaeromyxobacteraceae bacterium]